MVDPEPFISYLVIFSILDAYFGWTVVILDCLMFWFLYILVLRRNVDDEELIALNTLFQSLRYMYYRYVSRTANIFPFHSTATKEVSSDQEFCLSNSVLYPGLEGELKRSKPYLFGVSRFFTKGDVFRLTLQWQAGGPCFLPSPVNNLMERINIVGQMGPCGHVMAASF